MMMKKMEEDEKYRIIKKNDESKSDYR